MPRKPSITKRYEVFMKEQAQLNGAAAKVGQGNPDAALEYMTLLGARTYTEAELLADAMAEVQKLQSQVRDLKQQLKAQ